MKKMRKIDNFTHWRGKATGRKGMGMELALLVLFVVMACSILLVSSAMLGKSNLNDRKDRVKLHLALDQVAEQALEDRTNQTEYNGCTVDRSNSNSLVITDADGNTLTVTWEGNTITGWTYG